jgi:protocatechuate 3,4-dioxygenase beta subunit
LSSIALVPFALCGPAPLIAAAAARKETADLIAGPFYPVVKPHDVDTDLTLIRGHAKRATGQVVHLSGSVLTVRGDPVPHARVDIWHANAHGRYAHPSEPNQHLPLDPDFQGVTTLRTDRQGRFSIVTIKPGPYPTARGDWRAPHIHFDVRGAVDRKVTQLFFPDEPLNAADRHLNSVRRPETLIAQVSKSSGESNVLAATWDLILTSG